MELNVWIKPLGSVLSNRVSGLRTFSLLITYLIISYSAFSTSSVVSPTSNKLDNSSPVKNASSNSTSPTPGYYQPVNFDLIKGWDFENLRGRSFDNKSYIDGLKLHHQHIPGEYPKVQTTSDNKQVKGSLNGFAVPMRSIRHNDSNKEVRRKYARAELKAYIDTKLAPASRMGMQSDGRYFYTRIGEEYVYQVRIKPTNRWQKDKTSPEGKGQDLYCSVMDMKQDFYGSFKRARDATFKIRMQGEYANIVINADNANGVGYKKTNSYVAIREKVHLPEFFDGDWHTFTVRVKWHPTNGRTFVYFDDKLIWSRENFTNCYREDKYPGLGPYYKFGVYDAGFIANLNSGSNEKEVLVDYAAFGFYNPKGKGYEKYSRGSSSPPASNNPPSVSIIKPNDATYLDGDDITLVAEVSDSDGKVTKGSFWVNSQKINEQSVSLAKGYISYDWKSVPAGKYEVQVRVEDNQGETVSSPLMVYEVGGGSEGPSSSPGAPDVPESPEAPVAEAGEPGLRYAHYVGEWMALPNFDELTPVSQGTVPNFTFAPAGKKLYTFGLAYEGYLLIEQAGDYTFQVNANDGSNLYIDGKEIINNDGQKNEAQEKSGRISLSAGYHPIRLTFFERWGPQVLEVRYQGPGVKLQPIPDEVLFLDAPENVVPSVNAGKDIEITLPQTEITLNAEATDQDGTIASYQWAVVGKSSATIANPKAAKTKVSGLVAGAYQFSVTVQDNEGATTSDILKVIVKEAPVASSEPRLNYTYYEGSWSYLPNFAQLQSVKKGTISNFSLDPRNRNENFGFVFTGFIDIQTAGDYRFYTASDDGSALYIDNRQVVSNDGTHAKRERSGTIALAKGKHPIKVVFFEAAGQEVLEVSYQGPGIEKMPVPNEVLSLEDDPDVPESPEAPVAEAGEPGLRYAHYVGEWMALPNFDELTPVSQGTVPNFTFAPAGKKLYTFGLAYEGYLLIEQAGDYTFQVNANDGSNLYIDGKEIINNDGQKNEAQEKSGRISLSAGYHPIRLTFFERWGPQVLEVRYQGPGVKLQPIPDEVLFLDAPENTPVVNNDLIYVNFHRGDENITEGWNNLQSATTTGKQFPLRRVNGEDTDVSLRLETAWDGTNFKGYATGNNSGKYPDAVTRSYFWTRDREVIKLSGLSRDKLYSFSFFASSMFGGNRTTFYKIGAREVSLNASYNEEKIVKIENVRPSTNGEISIEVSRATGSSYGFLGALIIESKVSAIPSVKQEVIQQEDLVTAFEPEASDSEISPKINVYPNPSIGIINIKTHQKSPYWISDIQGNVIQTGNTSGVRVTTLDLTSLPKGVYLMKIQTDTEWDTQRIIIQ